MPNENIFHKSRHEPKQKKIRTQRRRDTDRPTRHDTLIQRKANTKQQAIDTDPNGERKRRERNTRETMIKQNRKKKEKS